MSRGRRSGLLSFVVGALVGWSAAWWTVAAELAECDGPPVDGPALVWGGWVHDSLRR